MCSVLNRSFISSLHFILHTNRGQKVARWTVSYLAITIAIAEGTTATTIGCHAIGIGYVEWWYINRLEWWQRLYRHVLLFTAFHSATFTFPSFTSADFHILKSCVSASVSIVMPSAVEHSDCVLCVWHNVNGTRNVKDMILTEMCARERRMPAER